MLKHFIVTRIGLGVYNEQWYERALDAFEAITFPSLSRQTSQNFIWLLTVDSEMPAIARQRLEKLVGAHPNYHIVPIDLMQFRGLRHGSHDWVFEPCHDYVLETRLLTDPTEYVVTSMIDADDAWRVDVVAAINAAAAEQLPLVAAQEGNRGFTLRHTAGLAITLPLGWEWFIPPRTVQPLWWPFLGMAVFIAHRFSSGISALSIRHEQWAAYADIMAFKRLELLSDQAMWVYARHQLNTKGWASDQARPVELAMRQTLEDRFGIDVDKANALLGGPESEESSGIHSGHLKDRADQQDRLYRIAALNRQIGVLERRALDDRPPASRTSDRSVLDELVRQKKFERAAIIEEFRAVGLRYFAESPVGRVARVPESVNEASKFFQGQLHRKQNEHPQAEERLKGELTSMNVRTMELEAAFEARSGLVAGLEEQLRLMREELAAARQSILELNATRSESRRVAEKLRAMRGRTAELRDPNEAATGTAWLESRFVRTRRMIDSRKYVLRSVPRRTWDLVATLRFLRMTARIQWLLHCLTLLRLGIRPPLRLLGRRAQIELIIASGLFDIRWYLRQYDDVRRAGVDPLLHYLLYGSAEGRDPNLLFDSDWYLQQNSDVRAAGINPLLHYLQHGAVEGRDPHPLFETDWYLASNPDVAMAGLNPLSHYLQYGVFEGRAPNSRADPNYAIEVK